MSKRSSKFYSRNEKQTLKALGLTPAPMSGAGWVIKEDGENETLMVQLKSTDSSSYRVNMLDIKKLEYHAETSNKIPVFLIQFLQQDKLYAMVSVDQIADLFYGLKGLKPSDTFNSISFVDTKSTTPSTPYNPPPSSHRKKIISNPEARNQFFSEKEKQYGKRNRKG